jgi:tetratricopeptide (TPR) repeat protein
VREAAYGKDRPPVIHPLETLAKILHDEGKLAEVEAIYQRALAILNTAATSDPASRDDNAIARQLNGLAGVLERQNRFAEAEKYRRENLAIFRKAFAEEDYHVTATFGALLNNLHSQHKLDDARVLCEEAIRIRQAQIQAVRSPERRGALWVSLYVPLMEVGRSEEAKAACRKAMEQSPTQGAFALNEIAWELANSDDSARRDPATAIELSEKVVDVIPEEGSFWNTLGVARYRAGRWEKAIAALDKSRELQKGKLFAWDAFFLAMAHQQLGHKEDALRWYGQAVVWLTEQRLQGNEELARLQAEAATLLGIPPAQFTTTAPSTLPKAPARP